MCVLQYVDDNLAVMSIGFLLSSPDDAVIWRGPKKNGAFVCALPMLWFLNKNFNLCDFVLKQG